MRKRSWWLRQGWTWSFSGLAVGAMCMVLGAVGSWGEEPVAATNHKALSAANSALPVRSPSDSKAGSNASIIPPGTILPVILRTTIAPEKMKQGQTVRGEIAQDVPLPGGAKIAKGSKIEGHVVEVLPAAGSSAGTKISIRFDKVYSRGQTIPMTTDLRAIAGFMDVQAAYVPEEPPSEGTPFEWLTRTQIGGESVYGEDGPVMSAENTSQVVGKSVNDGVLVQVRAKEGTRCRGPINGDNDPQALWVFSSDACGVYGISNVNIAHAGRTEPVGTVVFDMQGHSPKIRSASGMLLRVIS